MGRILIIGLDGASPALVNRWRDELPNLRQLAENGASGVLRSVIPPRSIPAWYCFATGMNPAKLGVFGFSQRLPGTYDYTFANYTYCQEPPFWYWLGQLGIETALLHLPGTFPPKPLRGWQVSGWPAPLNRGNLVYTFPESLGRAIDRRLGQPFEFVSPLAISRNNEPEMLTERLRLLRMHGEVAYSLLKERSWQVAVVVLAPLDRASHQFWHYGASDHPRYPHRNIAVTDPLKQVYVASDTEVGRLLSLLGPEDHVFVISDHGFGPVTYTFYLNEWLREKGYLVLNDSAEAGEVGFLTHVVSRMAAPLFALNRSSPTFRRLLRPFKKRKVSNFVRNQYVTAERKGLVRINHLSVDWSRTRAYCPDESSLYLNLRGRDPNGIVDRGSEAEQVLEELERELRTVHLPGSDGPLPIRIYRKEDIYAGRFLNDAPELTLVADDHRVNVMAEMGAGSVFDDEPLWSGNHTMEGLLLVQGPSVRSKSRLDGELIDIAPTVLRMLGLSVPKEMDGKVLHDLFTAGLMSAGGNTAKEVQLDWHGTEQAYEADELEQIEKQLKDLGYLG